MQRATFDSLRQLFSSVGDRVTLVDVSARDGLQAEPVVLSPPERAAWLRRILESGVPEAEAGSFVDPRRLPQMARTEEVLAELPDLAERLWVLVPNRRGVERARKAGARNLVLLLSATETHSEANLGRPIASVLEELGPMARTAAEAGLRARLAVSMAWIDPVEGKVPAGRVGTLCRRARELGIEELTLCDTYGGASPRDVASLLEDVSAVYPLSAVSLHLHDTFGVAAANALTGLLAGVRRFDGSVGGLGGCPFAPGSRGNVPIEDLSYLFESIGAATGVDGDALRRARSECLNLLNLRRHGTLEPGGT
ncbi:MAG: hydroxymethylglutaryl-CoA lyase [Deltaproteobacteria bacterium]|nr:hydroxymethylglutaryl-CoA lyase [Deltaproteobacteria bacterium]